MHLKELKRNEAFTDIKNWVTKKDWEDKTDTYTNTEPYMRSLMHDYYKEGNRGRFRMGTIDTRDMEWKDNELSNFKNYYNPRALVDFEEDYTPEITAPTPSRLNPVEPVMPTLGTPDRMRGVATPRTLPAMGKRKLDPFKYVDPKSTINYKKRLISIYQPFFIYLNYLYLPLLIWVHRHKD